MKQPGTFCTTLATWALLLIPVAAWSAEPLTVTGLYRAVTETEITAELSLLDDGNARYVVSWFNDDATAVVEQYAEAGRWEQRGDIVTVLLPPLPGTEEATRIGYEYTTCLSHRAFGGDDCSPGLRITATNLPRSHSWELWRAEGLDE